MKAWVYFSKFNFLLFFSRKTNRYCNKNSDTLMWAQPWVWRIENHAGCILREFNSGDLMEQNVHKQLKGTLKKKYACYVLITCDKPSEEGNMQVEMSYQGDSDLALFLLKDAQDKIDPYDEEICEESCEVNPKILYIE